VHFAAFVDPDSAKAWLPRARAFLGLPTPGVDTSHVAVSIPLTSISQDSVRFVVRFDAVGSASGGHFQFAPRGLVDTVALVRVATGWRLAEYGIDLFLYPATLRAMFDYDDT
jgi:hypothetical protein